MRFNSARVAKQWKDLQGGARLLPSGRNQRGLDNEESWLASSASYSQGEQPLIWRTIQMCYVLFFAVFNYLGHVIFTAIQLLAVIV